MKSISIFSLITLFSFNLFAEDISVKNAAELGSAISDAEAGDVIILAAGQYDVGNNLSCITDGTKENPITLRAQTLGSAVINFDTVEGFKVLGEHWIFENLEIHGVCADDSDCEHAFHIKGTANATIIRDNKVEGFNAHIKGGGTSEIPRDFADDVIIEYNEFYSDSPRQTANPTTPIDIVGGKRWMIRHNYIHDFEKAQGNNISYAAFLKGNSSNGTFSHNLVVCENLHQGGIRLGLSFGGGGTGTQFCEEGSCETEHRNGVMANNIIANCTDVGIYLNKSANTKIFNNTLVNTAGIDVRFDTSTALLQNNLLDGRIRERDGGMATKSANVEQGDLNAWFTDSKNLDFTIKEGDAFVDKGEVIDTVVDDFCLTPRVTNYDIGALEYEGTLCDTTSPFNRADTPTPIDPTSDAGTPSLDAGAQPDVGQEIDMGADVAPTGTTNGDESGCSCSTYRESKTNWTLAIIIFGFVFLRRRKSTLNN